VILFRGTANKLLLVFLVGETPTGGVHEEALSNAFEQIRKMCTCANELQCKEFRLMAPTFSGSVDSLRIAIETWRKGKAEPRFKIISGSATAVEPEQLALKNVSFSATVSPDKNTTKSVLEYLVKEVGVQIRDIAILKETN